MRVLVVLLLAACGRVGFDPQGDAGPADGARPDVAFGTGPWGNIVELVELNIGVISDDPTLTADELELYFNSDRDGTGDIFVSTRSSTTAPWGTPQKVVELSSTTLDENTPEVSGDGLEMYFVRDSAPSGDVYVSTRAQRSDPWSPPVIVPELSTSGSDAAPSLVADQLTMYPSSDESTISFEIYFASRATTTSLWSTPVPVQELSSTAFDSDAFATGDGLEIYWSSNRGMTKTALWRATRDSASSQFANLARITELDLSTHDEDDPWLSPDRHTIYFTRGMTQSQDMKIFRATR